MKSRTSLFLGLSMVSLAVPIINGIAIIAIDPLAHLIIEDRILALIDEVAANGIIRMLNQLVPFLIVLTAFALYLIPLLKFLWAAPYDEGGKILGGVPRPVARRLLNLPFIAAFATSFGWLLAAPVILIAAPFYGIFPDTDFFMQYLAHAAILFGFSFVLCYYALEVTVRTLILPRCLHENAALETRASLSLSIPARLTVFALSAFLLPALLHMVAIHILDNEGINPMGRPVLPGMWGGTVVLGLIIALITWFKMRTISGPISTLAQAAQRVGKGDFSTAVTVTSLDEIGQLGAAFNHMVQGLAERERMRGIFGKVVDPKVRDSILEIGASGVDQQGQERIATVVFFDLAGFTALSEKLAPARLVKVLNLYFEAVTRSVENQGGVVNKFIGDGVLAVFGIPHTLPHPERSALLAVHQVARRLALLNRRLNRNALPPLSFRAGVHRGPVIAGLVGSRDRMEYTVIGDAVNVASRLEGMGKDLGQPVVVSADTLRQLVKDVRPRLKAAPGATIRLGSMTYMPRGILEVRGRENPLAVYTCDPLAATR